MLWAALASDLGVQPQVSGAFRILDLDKRVLAFPYDDRGLDVIGDFARLESAYQRFNNWVLEHDRVRMKRIFSCQNDDGANSSSLKGRSQTYEAWECDDEGCFSRPQRT